MAQGNFKADGGRSFSALTDGLNLYGTVLPVRTWMEQLARRHDLELERPLVQAALARGYARQQIYLEVLVWVSVLLTVGIAFSILIHRNLRSRQMTEMRERFAADLHDELGANIHTIGLLNDVALSSMNTPDRLAGVLRHSRDLTERTGTAIRHCIGLQRANGLYDSLPGNMRRSAERIMADLEHKLTIDDEPFFDTLSKRAKTDLFLFYKECLVNISRHAEATQFETRLTYDGTYILLTVRDNGLGTAEVPSSLRRRARLLRARVAAEAPEEGGTCIRLKLKLRSKHRAIPENK
jgi:signal transduction histidine kinase